MQYSLKGIYEVDKGENLKNELLDFLETQEKILSLDLSHLEFIDVSCIQVLLAFIKECKVRNISLSINRPNDDVLQFFFMCGFIKSASYFDNSDLMDTLIV